MPGPLCHVLLCVDVVAVVILDKEVKGGSPNGLLLVGLGPTVMRTVCLVGGH